MVIWLASFFNATTCRLHLQSAGRKLLSKGWNTVFAQPLEVDAGAYSKALSEGRNNCTMREEIFTAQTDA